MERISNWVEAQVGPSLAILVQTMGPRHIVEIAMDFLKRLTDKQEFLISDYNSFRTAAAL